MHPLYQLDLFQSMPFPSHPLCSDDLLSSGLWRAPLDKALKEPYIQANPRKRVWALLFDVDRPLAVLAWENARLPPPTWTSMNPKNGHAHIAYVLSTPVAKSDAARRKPIRLLARIQHAMTVALDADRGYVGLITKTPTHARWRTAIWRTEPYDLDELRNWLPDNLPLAQQIKKPETLGYGRNVSLFDSLRQWAYSQRRNYSRYETWLSACLSHAEQINTFTTPLAFNEVKATAKSVAKWVWENFDIAASDARFSALQAHRGRKGAEKTNSKRQVQLIDLQAEILQ